MHSLQTMSFDTQTGIVREFVINTLSGVLAECNARCVALKGFRIYAIVYYKNCKMSIRNGANSVDL